MMKRFVIGLIVGFLAMVVGFYMEDAQAERIETKMQVLKNNSDGSKYLRQYFVEYVTYEITEVVNGAIIGDELSSCTMSDKSGIFLLQDEMDIHISVGDIVKIGFNNGVEDDISSIEKLN